MPFRTRRGKLRRPGRDRRARIPALESLERRELLTTVPTITLARDHSSPGYAFVFQGTADPGALVEVDQSGGSKVGSAVAAANGSWRVTSSGTHLANGEFRFHAVAQHWGTTSATSADVMYRPNFVLVNTDDMAAHDLPYMPRLNQLIAASGTTFTNSFVPTSLSGPSRASLLTGQYAHTNGVFESMAPLGGEVNLDPDSTLPNWLHSAGYRTAAFGKSETYIDDLESEHFGQPPPGWDEFSTGLLEDETEYHVSRDGVTTTVPNQVGGSTYVWLGLANSFLHESRPESEPFLLYFAPHITHQPYDPAPQYAGSMSGIAKWRPASYNVVPPDVIGLSAKTNTDSWDKQRQKHLETLQSVDEAIGSMFDTLSKTGELDNTVFVFTADNGLMWGEHALFSTKDNFYEESLRVPLVIRDGRVPTPHIATQMALNIDLAPTFASMAGISPPHAVDGLDLTAAIHGSGETLRSAFVTQHEWTPGFQFLDQGYGTGGVGIRTDRWKYVEYQSGKRELFDLLDDPAEMHNLGASASDATQRQQLATWLHSLLPADRTGPTITNLADHIEYDGTGAPYLRVTGNVSDVGAGDSQVRSPEYFIDKVGTFGWGKPLDTADGSFNASTEPFRGIIPLSTISQLSPGSHTLYVRGRDVAGNWGPLVSLPLNLPQGPHLSIASDTGDSPYDGVTLDSSPVIVGDVPSNAEVALYLQKHDGSVVRVEDSYADANGYWIGSPELLPGRHQLIAIVTDAATGEAQFTSAVTIHIAAGVQADGRLHVVGTRDSDDIIVDAGVTGLVSVVINGISAGSVAWTGGVEINGLEGDDKLTMWGSLPAILTGGDGNDTLQGGDGDDVLEGDSGFNQLQGRRGNDRYLFTSCKATTINVLTEFSGEGYDTLEFSNVSQSIVVNLQTATIASYSVSGFVNSVRCAAGTPLSYEAIIGGTAADVMTVHPEVRVAGGGGGDRIFVEASVQPGILFPISTLAATYQGSSTQVQCVLTASQGLLWVSLTEQGGVRQNQVWGNGTGVVEMIATTAQINNTLRALPKLNTRSNAAPKPITSIEMRITSLGDDSTLEKDVTSIGINVAPVITLSGTLNYTVMGPPLLVAASATVEDADQNLAGGTLSVSVSSNADVNDRLWIKNVGSSVGQIGVSGVIVTYGGVPLGTFSGGAGSSPLVVQLAATATNAAVQKLLRSIAYRNTGDTASTLRQRTIAAKVSDSAGAKSNSASVTVNVIPVNHAPVLNVAAVPALPSILEDHAQTRLVSSLLGGAMSDVDAGALRGVAVLGRTGQGRWEFALDGITWQPLGAVTATAARLLPADASARVRFVPAKDWSGQAGLTFRAWDLTYGTPGSWLDPTGNIGGQHCLGYGTAISAFSITPVNDSPVLLLNGASGYIHDSAAILLSPAALVSDVDNANLAGGSLNVRVTTTVSQSNRLLLGGSFSVDATNRVLKGSQVIGRLNQGGGYGRTDFVVTFNSFATPNVVQQLVRSLLFRTVGGSPGTRTLAFAISDGRGGISASVTKDVNVY